MILPTTTTDNNHNHNHNQEVLDVFVNHLGKEIQEEHEDLKYLNPLLKDELEKIRFFYNQEKLATLQIATDYERKDDTTYYFALPPTARRTIPITDVAKLQCFVADDVKGRESLTCGYELSYQPQDDANNNSTGTEGDELALCYPITQYVKVVGAITGCRGKKKQIEHMIKNKRHVNFFVGLSIKLDNEENNQEDAAVPAQFRRGVGRELLGGVLELRFLVVHRTVIDRVVTLLESFATAAAAAQPTCTTTATTTTTATLINTLYQTYPRCPSLGRIVQQQGENYKWKATREFLQSIRVSISDDEENNNDSRTELFTLHLQDGLKAPPPPPPSHTTPQVATWHGKKEYPAIPLSAIRTLKIQVGSRILVDRAMQPASAFQFRPAEGGGFYLHCRPTQTTMQFLMDGENNRNVMAIFSRNPSFLNRVERTITPTFYLENMARPIAGALELEGFSVKLKLVQTQMKHMKLEALGIELA